MSADLVSDDLWERVAPLLPARAPRRHRYPGRLPADDRAALRGIVYVLCKSVSWRDVPAEQVGCSGVTAWRRLRDWTEAGVWPRLHEVLLTNYAEMVCWRWTTPRSTARTSGPSKGGSHRTFAGRPGPARQQAPPDRRPARNSARRLSDQRKPPRSHSAHALAGRDAPDSWPARPTAAPTRRPFGDRGYDVDKYRFPTRARGIRPKIARRGVPHGSGLGKTRWVAERTFGWLHQFKRLRIRYERRADRHLGLLRLACSIICLRRLKTSF